MALVGFPERAEDVYNALAVLADGKVAAVYRKNLLPNYGVFDEQRYFQAGESGAVIDFGDAPHRPHDLRGHLEPGAARVRRGAGGRVADREPLALPLPPRQGRRARADDRPARPRQPRVVAFCNLVGGQDELVFDGHSLVVDHEGEVLARGPQFAEGLVLRQRRPAGRRQPRGCATRGCARRCAARCPRCATSAASSGRDRPQIEELGGEVLGLLEPEAEVYAALVLGTRDYVEKNGFEHVVLGLSGGIDSSLVALVAVDALGAERVTCVTMPSRFSSEGTRGDAGTLAANLGVELLEIPIGTAMETYDELLASAFDGREPDITEENLQARIRGNLLMALSNKFGWLVLTTGNKSENSVGYSTLYGDSAGGFAVIQDVPKTLVYRLVAFRGERDPESPVPETIVTRPPSAELREGQADTDSLPDYDTLDAILEAYVEEDADREQLELMGLPAEAIERVLALVDRAEYKRRQAPPGIKITPRAFGRDRRMPITNRYRG